MNILLTGAIGFIGEHVLRALQKEGHQVVACVRNLEKFRRRYPHNKSLKLDFATALNPDDWQPHLQNIDAVINAVGIIQETGTCKFDSLHNKAPSALFKACEQTGVRKVIQISALGADSDAKARYHASKGAADEFLKSLSLDWVILKPSIVYGSGAKSMALFAAMAALPVTPLVGDGKQRIQPVFIDDLVAAIVHCLDDSVTGKQTINAVGPTPISFEDLMRKLGNWLGKNKTHTMPIPVGLIQGLAPIGRWIDEPAFNKESIVMLQQGNTADVTRFAKFLGYLPKSLDQTLQDSPPTQADRWHAHLYFMRPALRFSIALIWIWAGWVSAFVYPIASSYQMLEQVGITGLAAPVVLYGASAMDFILGIAMLFAWHLRWIVVSQVIVMLSYTLIISIALPEYWFHPFGPLIKNLPILAATIVLLILEEEKP